MSELDNYNWKEFNPAAFKLMLVAAAASADFPGISEKALNGFREWINVDENWAWVLDRRDKWEEQGDAVDPEPEPGAEPNGPLNLVFTMTHQHKLAEGNYECGFLWIKATLVVQSTTGSQNYQYNHRISVKQKPHSVGKVNIDLLPLPPGGEIATAKLFMVFDSHEGVANDDNTGEVAVSDGQGNHITDIKAAIFKAEGISKARPRLPVDLTGHLKTLYS